MKKRANDTLIFLKKSEKSLKKSEKSGGFSTNLEVFQLKNLEKTSKRNFFFNYKQNEFTSGPNASYDVSRTLIWNTE